MQGVTSITSRGLLRLSLRLLLLLLGLRPFVAWVSLAASLDTSLRVRFSTSACKASAPHLPTIWRMVKTPWICLCS